MTIHGRRIDVQCFPEVAKRESWKSLTLDDVARRGDDELFVEMTSLGCWVMIDT